MIYLCLVVIAVFFSDKFIFQPPEPTYQEDGRLQHLQSADGSRIAAFYRPPRPGFPTLLYSHGNAEDLGGVEDLMESWNAAGLGVLAYDYPGYGCSTSKPTEASCEQAITAAWNHLITERKTQPGSIILVGRSVGSGPSVWLAAEKAPAGLVLLAPFTSAFRTAVPFPLFPRDRFPNLARIPQVKCPLLVIHGEADTIIRPWHGRKLVEAATTPDKRFVPIPGAGHNDLTEIGGEQIDREILTFATRVAAGSK
ncbi:MAG: alpha/beta hydrolase [Luteolibacter sp.]